MESEEFKVCLVMALGVALIYAVSFLQVQSYSAGYFAGKVSVLAPEKGNKE